MRSYKIEEVKYGSQRYQQTVILRDHVMRKPLGLSISNDDLSYEKQATVLVAFEADTIVGTGVYTLVDDSTAKVGFLCVDTTLQKGGIGRAILAEIERRLALSGIKKIYLEARVSVVDFYKTLGYQEYGEIYSLKEAPIAHIRMEKIL